MSKISTSEQEERDFDWFAIDKDGCVGHFTTAGFKFLPVSVSISAEDLAVATDYFENRATVRGGHRISESLPSELGQWKGESNEKRYLTSFVSMADKGLYSYDIATYIRPGLAYFCVAIPDHVLRVDEVPMDIRTIIERTAFAEICFNDSPRIEYELTLG
jgi:hypothetical protein